MKLEIYIKGRPLSLNAAYKTLPNGARVKSKQYKEFRKYLESQIKPNTLTEFSRCFDSSLHELKLTMMVYISKMYTKEGKVSKLSGDCDNFTKLVSDFVFSKLELDDCLITDLRVTKNNSQSDFFLYILEIIPK